MEIIDDIDKGEGQCFLNISEEVEHRIFKENVELYFSNLKIIIPNTYDEWKVEKSWNSCRYNQKKESFVMSKSFNSSTKTVIQWEG